MKEKRLLHLRTNETSIIMNSHILKVRALLVWIFTFAMFPAFSYNMRQSSNIDGLSNSAILSLCRDDNGFLWIGTCDGVNIADGTSINPFTSIFPGQTISGNIIEKIVNGGNGIMWVLTNHGLDLVDTNARTVSTYSRFNGQESVCVNENGIMFIIDENSQLLQHDKKNDSGFSVVGKIDIPFEKIKKFVIRGNSLWIISDNGIHTCKVTTSKDGIKATDGKTTITDKYPVRFAKVQDKQIFIIDNEGFICEIMPDGKSKKITDISEELSKRGKISDIVKDNQGNFFISFSTDGVLWVGLDETGQFQAADLGLQVGVFCLEQSPDQDVIWIGSDCQGVYTYWDDSYSIRSFDFNAFNNKISHPIRAIHLDKYKNLWLGTKGDGLLKITDFNEYYPPSSIGNGNLFTSSNSGLLHNSVFAFSNSSRPILWIATEEGLNYYNYNDGKLHKADINPNMKYVHGVLETNDSTLWLCTLGQGVAKIKISGDREHPRLSDVKKYALDNGAFSSNQFFSIVTDDKGNLYFCNRGQGMFEIKNDKLTSIPLKNDFGTNGVKDIFDALKTGDTFWLGTGSGVVKSSPGNEKRFAGSEYGFTNNTIHEIISASDGKIWVTTNNGIVSINPETYESLTYGKNYGINVTEFSDGASFKTDNTLILGGINGIVTVIKHKTYTAPEEPFVPRLSLLKLKISGEEVPLNDHLETSGKKNTLIFEPEQNHFSLTLVAPDFINGENYTYYYTLDGDEWISNGASPTITFNHMNHGTYNLNVKYVNRATGIESDPYLVKLIVKAPWYLTGFAKFIYLLIILGIAAVILMSYLRRQKEKQEKQMLHLEQAHKEEVYEEKLRFFTNITHEFCTPLTLIYGPCERIMEYIGSDDYIKRYVGLIQTNAKRLNNLIQELIDFRRIETGHKSIKVRKVGVSELCTETYDSFSELAERNSINYINDIKPDIVWNSDYSCLKKILNNLISNAFKYTNPGGTIKIGVEETDGRLHISVYNTGKGIREEDKKRIFNRYTVLDNVEQNAIKGISSRNGLGMAICHSMVDMLHGKISIDSEVGKFAEFIVVLPQLTVTESIESQSTATDYKDDHDSSCTDNTESTEEKHTPAKQINEGARILVVDDNKEILTLLRDSLTQYNVVTAENADEGIVILKETPPDLIISDIMMPGTDGTEFARQVKGNKHTMHIPLVLLSAKTSNDEKIKGIEAGADAYIGKPFSVSYLKAIVKRLLENREYLKEYYNSSASTFEFSGGKLMHREEKDFLTKVTDFIDAHIDDNDLSAEQIALHLKTGSRNLYRKFKEVGEVSPNDFIKNHRIHYAAKLLLTTSLTVQEIIYRCGFTNRSHFYKEFSKRYNTTPKEYRSANQSKDADL